MTEVVILDVGHGNSCLVKHEDGAVIIDAPLGPSLLEALEAEGIREVRLAIASHSDADHLGGLMSLLLSTDIVVSEVRCNPDAMRRSKFWDAFRIACKDAKARSGTRLRVEVTNESTDDLSSGDLGLEVVYPSPSTALAGVGGVGMAGETLTPNSMSAVIRVHVADRVVVLLAADLDLVVLAELEESRAEVTAPVLVFPHHGGLPGTSDAALVADFTRRLMRAVEPSTVVFSLSRTRFRNPHPVIVETIRAEYPNIHIACTQLSRRCSEDALLSTGHLASRFASGRLKGHCCAGTLVLTPDSSGPTEPTKEAHETAVAVLATRLCR